MDQQAQTGAQHAPGWECSSAACRTTFPAPVQHCLTCGALLKGALLSERFRIEALLGRGGMGAVYRATDLALGRSVALKVLAPYAGTAGDAPQELRARFFREARLAAQLDHPNIVPVLHFDIDGPLAYLVMPLLTGGTLAQRLRPRQPTDVRTVAGWLSQLAAALDFAHQRPQPIIHRDVKPGNLLFHEDGRLCLSDFGIARLVAGAGETAHLTRTGVVLGSLAYMAPEQINGHAVPASDQYSAGVLTYEALTGVLPFDAADNYALILQHASATPPLPSEHVPHLPREVDAVLLRALAKQPEARFPTVSALAEAFERALAGDAPAQLAQPARMRAALPAAPRPTFQLDDRQGWNEPFADDPQGERPTEAATLLRLPPGRASWQGGPPQKPPGAPGSRSWWIPALFVGLAAVLLCVLALAALRGLSPTANPRASVRATSAPSPTPSPTPTQTTAQRYTALLHAAESNDPIFEDALHKNNHDRDWQVSLPGTFNSKGLVLPTRTFFNRDSPTVHATIERQLTFCDVEVDVKVSSSTVIYGLGFFPEDKAGHALFLSAGGGYEAVVADANDNNQGLNLTPNADLALTHDKTYPLEIIIQGDQFAIFLDKQFITSAPFSPAFSGSEVFALFSLIQNDQPPANVLFSNLKIYSLS